MNPVSTDVKDLLVAEGIGTFAATTGWGIFIGYLPETTNNVIVIYDISGRTEPVMDKAIEIRYDSIQIKVRGLGHAETYQKIYDILLVLREQDHFIINDSTYLVFRDPIGPNQGERDDKERISWILTIEAVRQPL